MALLFQNEICARLQEKKSVYGIFSNVSFIHQIRRCSGKFVGIQNYSDCNISCDARRHFVIFAIISMTSNPLGRVVPDFHLIKWFLFGVTSNVIFSFSLIHNQTTNSRVKICEDAIQNSISWNIKDSFSTSNWVNNI